VPRDGVQCLALVNTALGIHVPTEAGMKMTASGILRLVASHKFTDVSEVFVIVKLPCHLSLTSIFVFAVRSHFTHSYILDLRVESVAMFFIIV
jgi:hypothetical protein